MESLTKLDATYIDLKRRLSQLFSYYPNAWVAAPLSLGLHPDHVLVSTACKSLPLRDRVFFYEDLPYSMAYRLDGIRRHVTRFDSDLRPVWVDVEGEVGRKLKNLRLYGSQLGPMDLDRTIGHSRRLKKDGRAYERIWTYQTSGIWPSQRTPPAVLA
jgi:LmbE family N-acetylglucosaminyl deacetylase